MTGNGFGHIFRLTTFGESHGPAIGCILEGVPSEIAITQAEIQEALNKRRPAQSSLTTQRKEPDTVEILSGVFEGKTTGTPIGLLIKNQDSHSKDYDSIKDKFRPSHADFAYFAKYKNRDYRGGGRASARETALRVAAGVFAEKILSYFLKTPFDIQAGLIQIGNEKTTAWDKEEISRNPFFCPDKDAIPRFEKCLNQIRCENNSIGAIIEIRAFGFPAGLGEPVYDKLDADLAKALMSINAVKGVEFGDGFNVASMTGKENADEMERSDNPLSPIAFKSNHAGGIIGGLSTSQPIIARIALKPTPSIAQPLKTLTTKYEPTEIQTFGRHDACVGIRGVVVAKAMVACVLADHLLRFQAQYPSSRE